MKTLAVPNHRWMRARDLVQRVARVLSPLWEVGIVAMLFLAATNATADCTSDCGYFVDAAQKCMCAYVRVHAHMEASTIPQAPRMTVNANRGDWKTAVGCVDLFAMSEWRA